jgi:hypothetical protein
MTITVLCLVIAIVCFFIRGLSVKTGQVDLGYIGWAFVFCAVLSTLIR